MTEAKRSESMPEEIKQQILDRVRELLDKDNVMFIIALDESTQQCTTVSNVGDAGLQVSMLRDMLEQFLNRFVATEPSQEEIKEVLGEHLITDVPVDDDEDDDKERTIN